jgi:ABC-type multidrug transport system fused ATPase/permease subunit
MDILSLLVPLVAATLMSLVKSVLDKKEIKRTEIKIEEAEKQAFPKLSQTMIEKIENLAASQEGLEERAQEISKVVEKSQKAVMLGNLFNLNNKQIESYQDQTRSRASWSFYIALIAMFFGFIFIFWGGQYILTNTGWDHITAGSAIAAIGGSISAYITKTFLDVHKLSINQLNRYFEQPVINDHILMAQRLADNLPNDEARQTNYELIINSITKLIVNRTNKENVLTEEKKTNQENNA